MTDPRVVLAEIQQRADAATEGTWQWFGPHDHPYLATRENGRIFVMRFFRSGMQGAQPMMRGYDGNTHLAKDIPIFEVCPDATSADDPRVYRDDITGLRSPDAEFIAASRTDVPRLVKALTDVLDEFDYYSKNGTEDEQDVIAAIREKVAAALAGES